MSWFKPKKKAVDSSRKGADLLGTPSRALMLRIEGDQDKILDDIFEIFRKKVIDVPADKWRCTQLSTHPKAKEYSHSSEDGMLEVELTLRNHIPESGGPDATYWSYRFYIVDVKMSMVEDEFEVKDDNKKGRIALLYEIVDSKVNGLPVS
ncbi:MAG: hypothetical protein KGH94_04040 [Candidatus Micrarchaeota archaeon]|nr:hypothetical protein [Candidatus Micrarchaeota archaeon]